MRRTNVEPSPSSRRHEHFPTVVGGHVAHDREPEPSAAGVPAARLVDTVEPLEDPVVVGGRDADAVVGDHELGELALDAHADLHGRPGLAVLHGVLDQVAQRRHELATVAAHPDTTRQLERGDVDPAQLGERPDPLDRPVDDVDHVDEIADRLLAELDAGQLHQVIDRAGHTVRLVDHAPGDALHDLGVDVVVGAVGERLGEHRERTDRGLQLVADVGHEVGAHGVDPPPFADVLDRDHRPATGQR